MSEFVGKKNSEQSENGSEGNLPSPDDEKETQEEEQETEIENNESAWKADWSDVQPIKQKDPEVAIASIDYDPKFSEVMDYLRAALLLDEKSERSLKLTGKAVEMNAANYTAWYFRRKILRALGSDLGEEINYIGKVIRNSTKNYQVWYHRRCIVDESDDCSKEMDFVAEILQEDAKNYHAWSHRQWCISRFNELVSDTELMYIDQLLEEDVRNNSAWNQRWFMIKKLYPEENLTVNIVEKEISYAFNQLAKALDNESPVNYIRGYMQDRSKCFSYNNFPEIKTKCISTLEYIKNNGFNLEDCRHLAALLLEVYEEEGTKEAFNLALQLANELSEADQIRSIYWKHHIVPKLHMKLGSV